jgi:hypothetical protein
VIREVAKNVSRAPLHLLPAVAAQEDHQRLYRTGTHYGGLIICMYRMTSTTDHTMHEQQKRAQSSVSEPERRHAHNTSRSAGLLHSHAAD